MSPRWTPVLIRWLMSVCIACTVLVGLALNVSPVLPDGGEVVFAGYRSDVEWGIYRVDVNTRLTFRLSNVKAGCCLHWPPGSSEIAFINYAGRVVFVSADGRDERILQNERLLYSMSDWSPDGTQVVVPVRSAPDDLQIVNAAGEVAQRFRSLGGGDSSIIYPRWSPDSRHILYMLSGGKRGIYTLDIDEGEARQLTGNMAFKPVDWSPDGEQIALIANQNGQSKIFLMRADGSQSHALIPDDTTQEFEPVWSPDGTKIAFMSNPGRRFNLHLMTCDPVCTGATRQLTNNGLFDWTYTWSPDSSKIAVIEAAPTGVSVSVIDTRTGSIRSISDGFSLISTLVWRP